MFEDLLPAVERGIIEAAGAIPVVFKGIERTFEKGETFSVPSRHDYHELTYMRSGKAEFDIEGRKVVLEKGGSLVLRPLMSHAIRVEEGYAEIVVLYFGFATPQTRPLNNVGGTGGSNPLKTTDIEPRSLEKFLSFANGNESGESQHHDPYILIRGKSRQDIAGLVERILRENRMESYGQELMMQLLAMELLVALARGLREEWEESLRVRTGKARELVRIARDYIIGNHDRDISVAEVAGYVFLSQGYFTRAFRDETGLSPMAFLMQIRVEHACKLLEKNDIKVSGVADAVGFSSPQRFNAAFRKHIGSTPMEYRRHVLRRKNGNEEIGEA
ncbi:MAG: AraC family transcriptional regulator [Eubacteriales bacterium]|nr:AraC family transcriptional regulator [Eubacteriales bacterium]